MSTVYTPVRWDLGRVQRIALGVGVICLAVCILGGFLVDPDQFFRSYLVAHQYFLGLALGSMVLVMLYHLTGGAWGYLVRNLVEAAMRTLPLMAVLFVPVALGVEFLYKGADPDFVAAHKSLQHKAWFLSPPWFIGKAVFYFVVWLIWAFVLDRLSRRQDQGDSPELESRLQMVSAPGLVAYGLTITFASIDWIMALQPDWYSTIFPVLHAVGQILSAMALAIVVLTLLRDRPPLAEVVAPDTVNDLGNLLLTFVILWTYMAFAQFMLIWVGNLPEENVWYVPRTHDGWQWVALGIALFHFLVPFLMLLSRDIKKNPPALATVAGILLFLQLVQLNWQVLPAFPGTAIYEHWMDVLAPLGVGGLWLAYYLWQLGQRPLLHPHDPNRREAVRLREHDLEEARRQEEVPHG
jgi:hypothetical protein